jgi:hypothetical protein
MPNAEAVFMSAVHARRGERAEVMLLQVLRERRSLPAQHVARLRLDVQRTRLPLQARTRAVVIRDVAIAEQRAIEGALHPPEALVSEPGGEVRHRPVDGAARALLHGAQHELGARCVEGPELREPRAELCEVAVFANPKQRLELRLGELRKLDAGHDCCLPGLAPDRARSGRRAVQAAALRARHEVAVAVVMAERREPCPGLLDVEHGCVPFDADRMHDALDARRRDPRGPITRFRRSGRPAPPVEHRIFQRPEERFDGRAIRVVEVRQRVLDPCGERAPRVRRSPAELRRACEHLREHIGGFVALPVDPQRAPVRRRTSCQRRVKGRAGRGRAHRQLARERRDTGCVEGLRCRPRRCKRRAPVEHIEGLLRRLSRHHRRGCGLGQRCP